MKALRLKLLLSYVLGIAEIAWRFCDFAWL